LFGAFIHANAAALTVVDVHLNLVLVAFCAHGFQSLEAGGGIYEVGFGDQFRADRGMGADEGALVALDAVFRDPLGTAGATLRFSSLAVPLST
jgi:hypothetical protein